MSWASLPLLAVDTETTGVDPSTDRIVELAAVEIAPDGTVLGGLTWIVNPGVDIPTEASNIHGITTAQARAEGRPPADVLAEAASVIVGHSPGPVVIYNARFDWPLLVAEAERHGVVWPDAPILDPLVLDKHLDPYRKGSRKLIDVARHYGVTLNAEDAHGATMDATAAGQTMWAMVAREPAIGSTPLDDLQRWQQRWHDDQALSFQDYVRRTKDPGFTKTLGWPLPEQEAAA